MKLSSFSKMVSRLRRKERVRRDVDRLIAAGDAANRAKQWAEAEGQYAAALALDPGRSGIWIQYGHALKEQGDLARAETAYRRSLGLDDAAADGHLQIGHVLKLQGRLDAAHAAYRESYLRDPASPHSRAELVAAGLELPTRAAVEQFRLRTDRPGTAIQRPVDAQQESGPHRASDLSGAVLEAFDTDFYYYANPQVRRSVPAPDREQCLLHFCRTGIGELLTIGEGLAFDPVFYLQTYLPNLSFTPANAYRHWATVGADKSWAPNRQAWIRKELGPELEGVEQLDISLAVASQGAAFLNEPWTTQVAWFADEAVGDLGIDIPVTGTTADALVRLADRLIAQGDESKAIKLYRRILRALPDHRRASGHYADALLRAGWVLEARQIYGRIVEAGQVPGQWTYISLASCHRLLGEPVEALHAMAAGVRAYPGDLGMRRRYDVLARDYLDGEWKDAAAEGRLDRFEDAQRRLGAACDIVWESIRSAERLGRKPIRSVALVANQDLAQCRFYRVEQKVEQLERAGLGVTLYDQKDIPAFLAEVHEHQAVIFYRVAGFYDVMVAISRARELGLATFYEIDDLIFDPAEYPGPLASYDDQIDREEFNGLKLGVPLFEAAMSRCEFGLASTTALAAHMARRVESGTVFVHRNGFGTQHETHATSVPPARGDAVTIFYGSGTKAHKEDFQALVEPGLVELVRRHGARVRIVLMGYVSPSKRLESIRSNVTFIEPNWDVDAYWAILSQVDVNIAVLKPSPMADCKSEIKWMEAAMFGVPSVVSDTATYREVVEPGVTGLVCRTAEEWTAALERLVGDRALRQQVGAAARARVRERYGIEVMARNLMQVFQQVQPPAPRTRKPVIVIVNVFYPPQAIGGATRVVHDNVRNLQQSYGDRYDFEVFTSVEGGDVAYATSSYVMDGVRVTGVATPDEPDIERKTSDRAMFEAFDRFLDLTRPDLVHFHCIQRLTTSIVGAAQRRGIPYVVSVHDGWWISDSQFLLDQDGQVRLYDYQRPLRTLETCGQAAFNRLMAIRPSLNGAARVLAVSKPFAEIYRSCGVGNVVAVVNGVSALPKPERTTSTDGRVRLGFIGGLADHKGYRLIRYALHGQSLGNLRLIAVDHAMASGSSRTEVWGATEVEFRAKTRQQDVARLYGEIDVLLAPSVWPESYGLVTREALACGCWVVASDRGSIGEYVDERNGFVIDVSTPDGLFKVLERIDANPKRFLTLPAFVPVMRQASEQADELAALYSALICDHLGRDKAVGLSEKLPG